ncbi:hypothetical protein IMSHALPRED_002743 [Imshaugia aleurites]|uniref:Uncharacterized protein n=1 Tax=Imshaugia aleurites TaxID=172621 RepID=A0A8H3J6D4_9LECA|nr:hypothetical protein IMSHALPRED_002743 [Imshaugia aleurites]
MALRSRFFSDTATATWLKTFGIPIAACLITLTVLYIVYAGTHRKTRNRRIRPDNPRRRARRNRDPETGADTADGDAESVDTLPRYMANGEGSAAPLEQGTGNEHDGVEEGERVKPPPYTVNAGGQIAEAEDGDEQNKGQVGLPVVPAPVHLQSL